MLLQSVAAVDLVDEFEEVVVGVGLDEVLPDFGCVPLVDDEQLFLILGFDDLGA